MEHEELLKEYPKLEVCIDSIDSAVSVILKSVANNGTIFTCGNGGSSADALHIVGELMKSFKIPRPIDEGKLKGIKDPVRRKEFTKWLESGIRAQSLVSEIGLITAFANDRNPEMVYAQQIINLANRGDVLIALSTSGNSRNIINAAELAIALDLNVISITGSSGGRLKDFSTVSIMIPETETDKIQNLTVPTYHEICRLVEESLYILPTR